jgi:hypothetical protein
VRLLLRRALYCHPRLRAENNGGGEATRIIITQPLAYVGLAQRDLAPAVDPAQLDLPARHKAEEEGQRSVLAWQRALRLHAAAEFLVEPFNRVRRPQRLPLRLGEAEEREQLVATFFIPHFRFEG